MGRRRLLPVSSLWQKIGNFTYGMVDLETRLETGSNLLRPISCCLLLCPIP